MGQKVNPIANRLGYIRGWDSNWFSNAATFPAKLREDESVRDYLNARFSKGGIARVVIERTLKRVTVTIHTSRPGIIIGKSGSEVEKLKGELRKVTSNKEVQINIAEIRTPDLDANIVAENIAKQIESRVSYRRAVKAAITATMRSGADGIKVRVSGRLGGAEMARTEEFKDGKTPLHTFRSDIDYSLKEAQTVYGKIGIKVWICRGEILVKKDLAPEVQNKDKKRNRGGGGGNNRRNTKG
ncbi:MAG TPA: 30S ribosomal protein S3 [Chitinophagales bacterium]|nr:30S ribosomal protein S3 [Chitinophagales bacterium]HRK27597.1 30S ribosomal protein S3 [Chitinophagales bacterium]